MEQAVLIAWVFLAVALIIIEIATTGILAIWFAIGSIVAAIIAGLYPGSYIAQLLAFTIISTILTIIGSKVVKSKQNEKKTQPVYSILGKTGICTKEIDNTKEMGQISINGDMWSARSKNGDIIPENSKIRILEIDGVKAVVEKI